MKRSILLSAAFALFAAFAGDEVPAAVKSKFASLYPNVKKAKWDKEAANYEAEFDVNGTETSVLFDASGTLLETETAIAVTALPKAAADYVAKNYSTEKIKEASRIVDNKGAVTYEAEVKSGDLIFDAQGNFVKKEVDEDKDKD